MKTLLSIVALAALGLSFSTSFASKPSLSTAGSFLSFSTASADELSMEITAADLSADLADETASKPISVSFEISADMLSIDLTPYGFKYEFDLSTNSYKWTKTLEKPRFEDTLPTAIEKPRSFNESKPTATKKPRHSKKEATPTAIEKPRPFKDTTPTAIEKPRFEDATAELQTSNMKYYTIKFGFGDRFETPSVADEVVTPRPGEGEEDGKPLRGDLNHDGYVNVDDLLIVINAWGIYDWPTSVDIAPLDEPDYSVDTLDLMVVLTDWSH